MSGYTSIERSFVMAFEAQGHRVKVIENKPFGRGLVRKIAHRLPGAQAYYASRYNRAVLGAVEADTAVVFYIKAAMLEPSTLAAVRKRYPQVQQICFNPDDPFNRRIGGFSMRACLPYFDHYFIWKRALLEPIEAAGCGAVHYLPFATDLRLVPAYEAGAYSTMLSFVGNGDVERQAFMEAAAVHSVQKGISLSMTVYGEYWKPIRGVEVQPPIQGRAYFQSMMRSMLNVNVLRAQNKAATNMRTFEIPACGGFMLHEQSEAAMEIFRANREAVYFADAEELIDKAAYYHRNTREREAIREAGYVRARQFAQSYDARVLDIVAQLGEEKSGKFE